VCACSAYCCLYLTITIALLDSYCVQGHSNVFKVGVQFLGLGYCTQQNTDGIPSFVDCSLLRNGNHTFHQKSWGGPSNFFGGSGHPRPPSGCALDCVINVLVSINDVTRCLSLNGTECLQHLCTVALRTDRSTADTFCAGVYDISRFYRACTAWGDLLRNGVDSRKVGNIL